MLDITTIILTYNEEKHIKRCLDNVLRFSKKVYVIDSISTDRTQVICKTYENVVVVEHKYPGNQAEQFNWALDNIPIDTRWTLRIDADEYFSDELIAELEEKLPSLPNETTGVVMKRDVIFMGRRIKYGKLKPIKLLRLWRTGKGRIENRIMDEHAILTEGTAVELTHYFFDENLNGIDAWTKKHLDYADRELQLVIQAHPGNNADQLNERNSRKNKYYKMPIYHRAIWFFILRYFLLGGFMDGKAGFVWNFLQCLWYRTLVDIKLDEHNTQNEHGGGNKKYLHNNSITPTLPHPAP